MTITLKQLQEEQVPWVKHNFGDRPSHQPLLGVTEELGELVSATNRTEARVGIVDWDDNIDLMQDAIADLAVFLCDYASAVDISMGEVDGMSVVKQPAWDAKDLDEGHKWDSWRKLLLLMMETVGQVNHHHLKLEQGIRGSKEEHHLAIKGLLVTFTSQLRTASSILCIDFYELVESVWAEVKKRDWKKDPNHADQNV